MHDTSGLEAFGVEFDVWSLLNARYVSTYLIRIYVSKLMAVLAKAIQPVLGNCFGDLNQVLHVLNLTRLEDSSLIIQ
jgi:hypothetical protein